MNKILALLLLFMFIPAISFTGEIHGIVKKGKSSVAGVTIQIKQGKTVYSKKTDKSGSYSIPVKEPGKCKLRVSGVKGILTVYSKETPVRFDLVILKDSNGDYYLKRK